MADWLICLVNNYQLLLTKGVARIVETTFLLLDLLNPVSYILSTKALSGRALINQVSSQDMNQELTSLYLICCDKYSLQLACKWFDLRIHSKRQLLQGRPGHARLIFLNPLTPNVFRLGTQVLFVLGAFLSKKRCSVVIVGDGCHRLATYLMNSNISVTRILHSNTWNFSINALEKICQESTAVWLTRGALASCDTSVCSRLSSTLKNKGLLNGLLSNAQPQEIFSAKPQKSNPSKPIHVFFLLSAEYISFQPLLNSSISAFINCHLTSHAQKTIYIDYEFSSENQTNKNQSYIHDLLRGITQIHPDIVILFQPSELSHCIAAATHVIADEFSSVARHKELRRSTHSYIIFLDSMNQQSSVTLASASESLLLYPLLDVARAPDQILSRTSSWGRSYSSLENRKGILVAITDSSNHIREKLVSLAMELASKGLPTRYSRLAFFSRLFPHYMSKLRFSACLRFAYSLSEYATRIQTKRLAYSVNHMQALDQLRKKTMSDASKIGDLSAPALINCQTIKIVSKRRSRREKIRKRFSCAIHIHCYYPNILYQIIELIMEAQVRYPLYVSLRPEIYEEVSTYLHYRYYPVKIELSIHPNIGRDIGPLLSGLGIYLDATYKYHLHIHTKKSPHLASHKSIGWLNSLLESLIGSRLDNNLDIILQRFENDKSIGLAFPASRRIYGQGINTSFVKSVLSLTHCKTNLSYWADFPVGNMYIARSNALSPLYESSKILDILPPEPVQVDGTVLHAIERALPLIASSQGFSSLIIE